MEWKKITIDDKEILDSFLKGKFENCDYNFTNQYIWSEGERLEYKTKRDGDILIIKSNFMDDNHFFLPFSKSGNIENVKEEIKELLKESHRILQVPEKWEEILREDFVMEEYRNSFDYIYNYEDLATLKGRKYSKKKNRISQFMRKYPDYTYEKITSDNINEIKDFQSTWCYTKECELVPVLRNENIGIKNVFQNFDKLDCTGGLIRVDGKVICYTIGEAITDEYVLIHIEKGLNDYIGSYQVINKLFLENEFQGFKYVNREDDFGDEGLREAKLSYHPAFLMKKYIITGEK
ncbi:DUF2156 domain-containing protein [Fusobacterium sp. PH5-44]|uniref:DUF2156 domain-containing protein n=1 Tax=unclassified Fusobacterium TaxID=2648384 RepID=UPI003D1D1EBD